MDRYQLIFFCGAALILVYQTFVGWRLGPVRQVVRFVALAGAYGIGFFGAPAVGPFLRFLRYPDFILNCLGGFVLGIVAYLVIGTLGGILFKKTSDQSFGLVWLFYGVIGSVLGMAFGVVLVAMAALGIRFLGTLAEGGLAVSHSPVPANHPGKPAAPAPARLRSSGQPQPGPVITGLVAMKQALGQGVLGEVIQTVDPIPKNLYGMLKKIGQVAASPEAAIRFLHFPGAQELVQNPGIVALKDDPEIAKEIANGTYLNLLQNSRVIKVCNDPKIAAKLRQFDLEGALDYSLKSDAPPAERP